MIFLNDMKEINAFEDGLKDGLLSHVLNTAFAHDNYITKKESEAYKKAYNYDKKDMILGIYKKYGVRHCMDHLIFINDLWLKNHYMHKNIHSNYITFTYEEQGE